MANGSLVCGEIVEVLGRDYLVRLPDGSRRLVSTDDNTCGNGLAHQGEGVLAWIEEDGLASVLTRVLRVPMMPEVIDIQ